MMRHFAYFLSDCCVFKHYPRGIPCLPRRLLPKKPAKIAVNLSFTFTARPQPRLAQDMLVRPRDEKQRPPIHGSMPYSGTSAHWG